MHFIDLETQYRMLKERIDARIAAVLGHGGYILGPEVAEFEHKLADYVGVSHAISCANGTDALVLALRALDIGPGDLVLTSPFTFFATGEAIALAGAMPVFADIDPGTFNIDPARLEQAIADAKALERGTLRAVMTVDLFGLPADYAAIEPICRKHGLILIADAAQGFGGEMNGKRAGAFGTVTTTSFFPAKPLGCYGDGGAILTNDDSLAQTLISLRMHGKGTDKYDNVRIGTNSRLDTIQAAILIEKLEVFPAELAMRQQIAARYTAGLPAVLVAPVTPPGFVSSWAQYSVLAPSNEDRARYVDALRAADIPCVIYYAKPLHLQTAFKYLGYQPGDFPVSEAACKRVLSLPMSPYLRSDDQDRVLAVLAAT